MKNRLFIPTLIASIVLSPLPGLLARTVRAKPESPLVLTKLIDRVPKEQKSSKTPKPFTAHSTPQPEPNYKTEDITEDNERVLLARMLFGEARNCSEDEMYAIARTPIHRANDDKAWNGRTVKQAILKPWQYSCFNENDPNLPKLKDPQKHSKPQWNKAYQVAGDAIWGIWPEKDLNATHYHTHAVSPSWKDSPRMKPIPAPKKFKHNFYYEK